jgi:hypothetical protein
MSNEGQSKENKEKNSLPLDQTNASELVHFPNQNCCPSMRQRRFIPVLSNFESIQVLAQPN